MDFSRNTLRLHLESLVDTGPCFEEESANERPRRPMFTYALSTYLRRQIMRILSEPYVEFVSLLFNKLNISAGLKRASTAKNEGYMRTLKLPRNPKRTIKTKKQIIQH
jgi:hypothetical protein